MKGVWLTMLLLLLLELDTVLISSAPLLFFTWLLMTNQKGQMVALFLLGSVVCFDSQQIPPLRGEDWGTLLQPDETKIVQSPFPPCRWRGGLQDFLE